MQLDSQFASDRQLRATHAGTLGHSHAPPLERRPSLDAGQQYVGRLLEGLARQAITLFADVPGSIRFAGLVAAWRQTEVYPDSA
jgi:hypothetical protein